MAHPSGKRILVIEDDPHISEGLKLNLALQGYVVAVAADGGAGLQRWKDWQPDLIVLDIMLPGIDGLSVLRHIRLEDERLPILILSAKDAADYKVKGLSYGVDDYLTKPFNLEEFLLRVERLLTRVAWYASHGSPDGTRGGTQVDRYSFGGNQIDFTNRRAYGRGGELRLTDQEIKLLRLFIVNRGKPLSRKTLLKVGWGYTSKTTTRTIDNFIVRFRKYFEVNPKQPVFFKSIRSVGYIFDH
jgi:DNA-binding response OmpR family regulator